MPICATALSNGFESGGNRNSCNSGAIDPNKDGPRITPAIISPITCGCRNPRLTTHPHSRQAARITNICKKKIMPGAGPAFRHWCRAGSSASYCEWFSS